MASSGARLQSNLTCASVTDQISELVLHKPAPSKWLWSLAFCALIAAGFVYTLIYLLVQGVGIFGINIPVAWAFPIVNTIWWIGIAHAGTLISAVLFLTRQSWRAPINRVAEAMAMFAIMLAGGYTLIHLGRPQFFYYLTPYPTSTGLWPQWHSALVWDFFAILTYLLYTACFLYTGLLPDLATLRDQAKHRLAQLFYGVLALGWRNSARHWHNYEQVNRVLAVIAAPIVVLVTGTISLDLAVSLVPGFHFTIFPPYFVAGAIFSGFATVTILSILLRKLFRLETLITRYHISQLALMMLPFALFVAYSYLCEMFIAFYSGEPYTRTVYLERWSGPYAPLYWGMLICNVALPQLLWFRRARLSIPLVLLIAILADAGMWLERFIIITSTYRDYMPSSWDVLVPTAWDWVMFIGSIGIFFTLVLLFIRFMPPVSMHDMRALIHQEHSNNE